MLNSTHLCVSLEAGHFVVWIPHHPRLEVSLVATTRLMHKEDGIADDNGCHGNKEYHPNGVGIGQDNSNEGRGWRRGRGRAESNLKLQVDRWKKSEKSEREREREREREEKVSWCTHTTIMFLFGYMYKLITMACKR